MPRYNPRHNPSHYPSHHAEHHHSMRENPLTPRRRESMGITSGKPHLDYLIDSVERMAFFIHSLELLRVHIVIAHSMTGSARDNQIQLQMSNCVRRLAKYITDATDSMQGYIERTFDDRSKTEGFLDRLGRYEVEEAGEINREIAHARALCEEGCEILGSYISELPPPMDDTARDVLQEIASEAKRRDLDELANAASVAMAARRV